MENHSVRRLHISARWAAAILASVLAAPALAFSPEKAGFTVKVRDELNPYRTFGVYVLPREAIDIEVLPPPSAGVFTFLPTEGTVLRQEPRRLRWSAPSRPGLYRLRIDRLGTADSMELLVFVMVPYRELAGETLNGYRIGSYPATPLRGLAIYRPPRGFVEVTPEVESARISPHFELGQFLCKQAGGYPKYVVLRERLLLKLEHLLQLVNREGYAADTFAVLSGFRTPSYNHAIGNVKYSRHQWGGAADIFIDADRDGVMDDLDGNGRTDVGDADVLYDLFDVVPGKREYELFVGGLGLYGATPSHGPFVHVDARGFRARWGR